MVNKNRNPQYTIMAYSASPVAKGRNSIFRENNPREIVIIIRIKYMSLLFNIKQYSVIIQKYLQSQITLEDVKGVI